jgi:hypothetical protein
LIPARFREHLPWSLGGHEHRKPPPGSTATSSRLAATPSWRHDRWAGNKMVPTEPRIDHRIGASRPAGHHARRVGAWLSRRLFCPLVARRVQSSIIAQADTLYSYALPTASRTRASAADRVILDYQSPASSPVAARRAGSVILTAQPAAGGGAGWGRREPGQNDTDAAGVLDPDARPEMDTSPGQRTARTGRRPCPGTPRRS